jgi:hypothetical protein
MNVRSFVKKERTTEMNPGRERVAGPGRIHRSVRVSPAAFFGQIEHKAGVGA